MGQTCKMSARNTVWQCWMDVRPHPKERPIFSYYQKRARTPPKTLAKEAQIRHVMSMDYDGDPVTGPLMVTFVCVYTRPKSVSKEQRPFHDVKPDLTNLAKTIEDAGNGIIWRDDCQFINVDIWKVYGEKDAIYVRVDRVDGPGDLPARLTEVLQCEP
jgi:Holliday junction resolvase RusA-like endonuclease